MEIPGVVELDQQFRAAIDFAKGSRVETGFGYLDVDGKVEQARPVELWITCRMTHVFALAHLAGISGTREFAQHGLNCLKSYFHDPKYGGWFSAIAHNADGENRGIPVNDRKEAYAHAFVLLAAASALAADLDGAGELLSAAEASQEEHWFDPSSGRVRESYDRSFSKTEDYRGINANMHTTEAYLAVADLTDNRLLLDRAVGILEFVADEARLADWRIPEHFDSDWRVLPDYNRDQPAHPFRPFGVTPGHGLEWSRLMMQARQSLVRAGEAAPSWMEPAAEALLFRAVSDGWAADGAPGFVYTTDFAGRPVVRERMHWVLCEAIGAAVVFRAVLRTENPESLLIAQLDRLLEEWWQYAGEHLAEAPGRWHHELGPDNRVSYVTWPGKPDVYHLVQMLLLPRLPVSPAFAAALREGRLQPVSAE